MTDEYKRYPLAKESTNNSSQNDLDELLILIKGIVATAIPVTLKWIATKPLSRISLIVVLALISYITYEAMTYNTRTDIIGVGRFVDRDCKPQSNAKIKVKQSNSSAFPLSGGYWLYRSDTTDSEGYFNIEYKWRTHDIDIYDMTGLDDETITLSDLHTPWRHLRTISDRDELKALKESTREHPLVVYQKDRGNSVRYRDDRVYFRAHVSSEIQNKTIQTRFNKKILSIRLHRDGGGYYILYSAFTNERLKEFPAHKLPFKESIPGDIHDRHVKKYLSSGTNQHAFHIELAKNKTYATIVTRINFDDRTKLADVNLLIREASHITPRTKTRAKTEATNLSIPQDLCGGMLSYSYDGYFGDFPPDTDNTRMYYDNKFASNLSAANAESQKSATIGNRDKTDATETDPVAQEHELILTTEEEIINTISSKTSGHEYIRKLYEASKRNHWEKVIEWISRDNRADRDLLIELADPQTHLAILANIVNNTNADSVIVNEVANIYLSHGYNSRQWITTLQYLSSSNKISPENLDRIFFKVPQNIKFELSYNLMRNANTSGAVLEHIYTTKTTEFGRPSNNDIALLVSHRNTTESMLRNFIPVIIERYAVENRSLIKDILDHKNTTNELRQEIYDHPNKLMLGGGIISAKTTPREVLTKLLEKDYTAIRRPELWSALNNPNLPIEHVDSIIKKSDSYFKKNYREPLCRYIETPSEWTLLNLLLEKKICPKDVISSPLLSIKDIRSLYKSEEFERSYFLLNDLTPADIITDIYTHGRSWPSKTLLSHPNTSTDILQALYSHYRTDLEAIYRLAKNPNTSADLLRDIYSSNNQDNKLISILSEGTNTPQDVLIAILNNHLTFHTLDALVKNHQTPPSLLRRIFNRDYVVRMQNGRHYYLKLLYCNRNTPLDVFLKLPEINDTYCANL